MALFHNCAIYSWARRHGACDSEYDKSMLVEGMWKGYAQMDKRLPRKQVRHACISEYGLPRVLLTDRGSNSHRNSSRD
jgi:hypothetical protein